MSPRLQAARDGDSVRGAGCTRRHVHAFQDHLVLETEDDFRIILGLEMLVYSSDELGS
jgi:hypothetical protein